MTKRRYSAFRRGLLASCAISAIAISTAHAGDPTMPGMWNGPYVGLNVGWGQSSFDTVFNDGTPGDTFNGPSLTNGGLVGGAQLGMNWRVGNNFVVGVEGDYDFTSLNGSGATSGLSSPPLQVSQASITGIGTIRARFGYAFDSMPLLAFVTGGVALAQVKNSATLASSPLVWSSNETRAGYVVGGGFEYAFARSWSVKAEGLYVGLGNQSETAAGFPGCVFTYKNVSTVLARAGINFHF